LAADADAAAAVVDDVVEDVAGDAPDFPPLFSGQPARAAAAANANRTERAFRGEIMAEPSHASPAEGRGGCGTRRRAARARLRGDRSLWSAGGR
jgi:hypothetical protein